MNELCMQLCAMQFDDASTALYHHGIMGMKWGVRRYQPYGSGGYDPDHIGKNTGLAARIAKGLGGLSGGLREAGERARFGTHKLGGAIDSGLLKAKRKGSSALSTLSAIGNTDVRDIGRDIGRMAKQKGSSALSTLSAIGNTDVRDIGRMAKRKASDLRGMAKSGEFQRMLGSAWINTSFKAATAGRDAAFGASMLTSMLGGAKPGSALDRVNSRYGSSSGKTTNLTNLSSSLSDIRQYGHGPKPKASQPTMHKTEYGSLWNGLQQIGDSRDIRRHGKGNPDFSWTTDARDTFRSYTIGKAGVFGGDKAKQSVRDIQGTSTTKSGRSVLESLSSLTVPPEALFNAAVDLWGGTGTSVMGEYTPGFNGKVYRSVQRSPAYMRGLREQLTNL